MQHHPFNNASISALAGIDGAVPALVTDIPAVADPNRTASGEDQLTSGHRIMDIQLIGTVHDSS